MIFLPGHKNNGCHFSYFNILMDVFQFLSFCFRSTPFVSYILFDFLQLKSVIVDCSNRNIRRRPHLLRMCQKNHIYLTALSDVVGHLN